jgi:1-phosphofructokinase/tagatose 6-phosphate kinase
VILCLAPTPAVDRLLRLDGPLRPGTIHRPVEVVATAGGKALNVARVAAALGAEVRVLAPLGGTIGRWITEQLEADGVTVERVPIRAEPRTCVSVAGAGQALTELYEPGAPLEPDEWVAFERAAAELSFGARWVTLSGSQPAGTPPDAFARLIRLAHRAGAHIALDSHGASLRSGLTAHPELVKVNSAEASEVATDVFALRELAGGNGHAAAVTNGLAGIRLVEENGRSLEASLPLEGAYPVGSGDALLAALTLARARGDSWEDALALGVAAGASSSEQPGAGRLSPQRARELAALVTVSGVDAPPGDW